MIQFTVENAEGSIISWKEDDQYWMVDDNLRVKFGEWFAPFPNEKNNSFAFGIVEYFCQSDNMPPSWYDIKIIRVKCERI